MDKNKHKIFLKTNLNKYYKEIMFCHYFNKNFHVEERLCRKIKYLSLKSKPSNHQSKNQDNNTEFVFIMESKEKDNKWIL